MANPKLVRPGVSALTGAGAGIFGTVVPLVGAAVGLTIQILAPANPRIRRQEHPIDGLVDGSVALLARRLFT